RFLAPACSPRTAMPTHSRQSSNPDHPAYASRFILINHGELIMKTLPTILTTMTLVAGLSLAPALIRAPAYAVDNMSSTDAPDLTSVRNAKAGTPLMQSVQTIGIDLPLKALVWQDASGVTWLSCSDGCARTHATFLKIFIEIPKA